MNSKLLLFLLVLPLTSGLAAPGGRAGESETTAQSEEQSPASILADQIKEIASSDTTSRKTQAKLITNAVNFAITAATEGIKDPAERLRIASELAMAATKAAPHFAATIAKAASSVPSIAQIDGALDRIQESVNSGIEAGEEATIANPVANPPRPPANPEFGGPNQGETVVSPSH